MLRNHIRVLLGTMTIALATSAVMGVAEAAEMTNAPGSACIAAGSAVLTARTDGQAENQGAAGLTAVCPVDRKQIGSSLATVLSGRVWVVDQHSTQDVCCRVVTKNPNGAAKLGDLVCSTGESSNDQALSLPSVTDPYTFSHFWIQCSVPAMEGAASRILTVRSTQE